LNIGSESASRSGEGPVVGGASRDNDLREKKEMWGREGVAVDGD
jgi:hypothetical protein